MSSLRFGVVFGVIDPAILSGVVWADARPGSFHLLDTTSTVGIGYSQP